MAEKRHVIGGNDGWLNVKREPGGSIVALPEYLQVEFSHNRDGRDFFKALEGGEQGKAFSVKQGNLKPGLPLYRPAAHLEFTIAAQKLAFSGGSVKAITAQGASAVAVGTHPIQIPDFPHELGSTYVSQSRFAKNWFYLGRGAAIPGNNDRYLHTGRVSLGCVTVDPGDWTRLYQSLILCRSGDGKTVGSIVVRR